MRIDSSQTEVNLNQLRLWAVKATLTPLQIDAPEVRTAMEAASGPERMTDGLPTVLLVEAWMCHEGRNGNGDVFVAEDFEAAAAQISSPNFLPMDWNHAAVYSWTDDPKAIGVWYEAKKEWNPHAKDHAGAWGIRASGVVWAWAFPEQVNLMLADQERMGHASFSMACIPGTMEFGYDEKGPHTVLRSPVFYTLSALSVPPADPDALGVSVEGAPTAETLAKKDERYMRWQEQLDMIIKVRPALQMAALQAKSLSATHEGMLEQRHASVEEECMTEDLKKMQGALEQANEKLAGLTVAETALVAAQAQVVELEASRGDLALALEAANARLAETQEALAARETANATLTASLSTFEAEARERTAAEKLTARMTELPAEYAAALTRKGEEAVTAFESRWKVASDEAWASFLTDIAIVGPIRTSYQKMSQAEGGSLPGTQTEAGEGIDALLAKTK